MRISSTQTAIRVIQEEHDLLEAIIHGMVYLVEQGASTKKIPEIKVFQAMIFYIKEYPEKVHHPKEDKYLFEILRKRTDKLDATIAELESQHYEGQRMVAELEHALLAYELKGDPAFMPFHDTVVRYADFYRQHMRVEEGKVFPVALEVLTPDDWQEINQAFAQNLDPRLGGKDQQELQKLFSLIVNITPPPIGVGPACSATLHDEANSLGEKKFSRIMSRLSN